MRVPASVGTINEAGIVCGAGQRPGYIPQRNAGKCDQFPVSVDNPAVFQASRWIINIGNVKSKQIPIGHSLRVLKTNQAIALFKEMTQ